MKAAYQGLYTIEDGKRIEHESAYAIITEMSKDQMNSLTNHLTGFNCEGYVDGWDSLVLVKVCDKQDYKDFMKVYKAWKKTL